MSFNNRLYKDLPIFRAGFYFMFFLFDFNINLSHYNRVCIIPSFRNCNKSPLIKQAMGKSRLRACDLNNFSFRKQNSVMFKKIIL